VAASYLDVYDAELPPIFGVGLYAREELKASSLITPAACDIHDLEVQVRACCAHTPRISLHTQQSVLWIRAPGDLEEHVNAWLVKVEALPTHVNQVGVSFSSDWLIVVDRQSSRVTLSEEQLKRKAIAPILAFESS
jgi:hypothetical protein